MKKIIFLFLVLSFLIGCQSEKEGFDNRYFNGYWLPKFKYGDNTFPNVFYFQDSIINISYPASGQMENRNFKVFPNDSLGISWTYREKQYYVKSKFMIISQDTFVTFDKKEIPIDSFFRISKDKVEMISEEWKGTLEVEPPRTK